MAIIGRPDERNDSDSQPRPLSSAYGLFAIFGFLPRGRATRRSHDFIERSSYQVTTRPFDAPQFLFLRLS